jgi:hypothetical protein
MKKKITYNNPYSSMPAICEVCGRDIEDGDECWYVGDGTYICDNDKCIKE